MAEFDIKDGTLSKIITALGETEVVIPYGYKVAKVVDRDTVRMRYPKK